MIMTDKNKRAKPSVVRILRAFFAGYTLTHFPSPDIIKKESKPDENGINIEETTKNDRKFTDQTGRSR